MKTLQVLFTPSEFAGLPQRDLSDTVCVVVDVLRSTSSMIMALANDAAAIVPVAEIPEALAVRQREPEVLLAGEREGLRIGAALTGGTEFDLGNSPREFTKDKVSGKTIVMTTTNGTRALRACARAKLPLVGSFLNLRATADAIRKQNAGEFLIVCSGTLEQAAYEDALCAGALCELLAGSFVQAASDSALMARWLFASTKMNLFEAASQSRNARRLMKIPELHDDVAFCLQHDLHHFAAALQPDGRVKKL
jgi:2-phosphosulfolactate phosphatase